MATFTVTVYSHYGDVRAKAMITDFNRSVLYLTDRGFTFDGYRRGKVHRQWNYVYPGRKVGKMVIPHMFASITEPVQKPTIVQPMLPAGKV